MKKYISDEIGDKYKEWEKQNLVFLTAPTGSGKTTFVLEKLVEYAESRNAKILYLVNRKILKKQIEDMIAKEIRYKVEDIKNVIELMTYQELETKHKDEIGDPWLYKYSESIDKLDKWQGERPQYDIIIADECHYFFSDSTYNPHTSISYDWIMYFREWSIVVFMSATIDRIKEYILKDIGYKKPDSKQIQDQNLPQEEKVKLKITFTYPDDRIREGSLRVEEYGAKADYSHIDIHILDDYASIADTIKEKKGKWLIFVDSIKKGKDIHHTLKDAEIDSAFIDAKWADDNDEIIYDTVDKLAKEEDFTQQVLVATSVIDNGVSIKNVELRNLVIMADTKEQFIQMLGRKRLDHNTGKKPERINLYILKRDKRSFSNRLQGVERSIEYIGKYYEPADDFKCVLEKVQKIPNWYRCFRNICFITKESVVLNKFADEQFRYLRDNYVEILDRFDKEDEYAFIRTQAKWIGKNVEYIIDEHRDTLEDKVKRIIDEYVGIELDRDRNVELREQLRIGLKTLLKQCKDISQEEAAEVEKTVNDLNKKSSEKYDRTLTREKFNFIMNLLKMEYEMEEKDGYRIINHK